MTDNITALIAEARKRGDRGTGLIDRLADALEAEHKRAEAYLSDPEFDQEFVHVKAERDRYRAEAESARKTGERILADALRIRAALEDALGHAHECYRSDLTCVDVRILARVLNEGAADV